ncbi:MAG: ABC transporter permease subunit [Lachnospiraceae bacterium]|nr:ABC transporter permease subunit [Lachnospiraceae bacterium]
MKQTLKALGAGLFWVLVWYLLAAAVNKPLLLPMPGAVLARVLELAAEASFWRILLVSVFRVSLGILGGLLLGVILGCLCHVSDLVRTLAAPLLTIIKAAPVASFIILLLIWIGRDIVPGVIGALIVIPVVYSGVRSGLESVDGDILEMAAAYELSFSTRVRNIVIPSVKPYFLSSIRASVGIGWKAGIAAEVLTVPVLSIGKMIYESKLYLETTDLFAWTLCTVLLSLIIEGLMTPGKKKEAGHE